MKERREGEGERKKEREREGNDRKGERGVVCID